MHVLHVSHSFEDVRHPQKVVIKKLRENKKLCECWVHCTLFSEGTYFMHKHRRRRNMRAESRTAPKWVSQRNRPAGRLVHTRGGRSQGLCIVMLESYVSVGIKIPTDTSDSCLTTQGRQATKTLSGALTLRKIFLWTKADTTSRGSRLQQQHSPDLCRRASAD